MSKKTSYLLGILLTIIIGTILYWFFCCKPHVELPGIEADKMETATPNVRAVTKNAFSVIDLESNLKFDASSNFNFKGSNFTILDSVPEGLRGQIEKLSNYLKDNQDKTIDLTGYYTIAEKNTSAFPNLGMARANTIKNYFVSQGIPSKAINTIGELSNELVPDESNIFYGPVSFNIVSKAINDLSNGDDLKALGDEIKADPLILYFDTASATIDLSQEQRNKVAKIVRYIDKVDNALIKTIGHTDNTSSRLTNVRLGQSRAEFAKNYLVNNGIPAGKISTSSKGPDQPIADNSTEEGRAKNRRVVVTIN